MSGWSNLPMACALKAKPSQIDLTDFSVAPPKLWRGLLKVGKVVRVQFDAVLR